MTITVRHLTDVDRSLIRTRYEANVPVEDIGREVGFSLFTVHKTLRQMGLSRYKPRPQHKVRDDLFAVLDSVERYWLGLLITDGNVLRRRVKLSLAKEDGDGVDGFCAFVNNGGSPTEYNNVREFRFSSPKTVERLKALGVRERKTQSATAPDFLLDDRDFWRGVIDGDGGVDLFTSRPLITLTGHVGSHLLPQWADFVSRNIRGFRPNVVPRPRHPTVCDVRIAGTYAQPIVALLYRRTGPVLASVKAGADRVLAWKPKKPSVCRKLPE